MISYEDVLSLHFYEKELFTGSYQGMRYRLERTSGGEADAPDLFRAVIWPGPYNYATTRDEQKSAATFPFTEEGKKQAVDWMNEQWQARQAEWPKR